MKNFNVNFPNLIIGGSNTVYDELDELSEFISPYSLEDVFYICVINDQIARWTGRVDIYSSLHGEKIEDKWLSYRPSTSNWDFKTFVHRKHKWKKEWMYSLDIHAVKDKWGGSSGLYAVQNCLLNLGFSKVVLCGIPMDAKPNLFRDEERWKQFSKYRRGWERALKETDEVNLKDCVRSTSGWTLQHFGYPDLNFILGEKYMENENNSPEELNISISESEKTETTEETKEEVNSSFSENEATLENEINESDIQNYSTEVENSSNKSSSSKSSSSKSTKRSSSTSKVDEFEQWWQDFGENLVEKGFGKKSLIVRAGKKFSKNPSDINFQDIVQNIDKETLQKSSLKEICREVSKKIN